MVQVEPAPVGRLWSQDAPRAEEVVRQDRDRSRRRHGVGGGQLDGVMLEGVTAAQLDGRGPGRGAMATAREPIASSTSTYT